MVLGGARSIGCTGPTIEVRLHWVLFWSRRRECVQFGRADRTMALGGAITLLLDISSICRYLKGQEAALHSRTSKASE
jgi:hypothetical protein